MMVWESGERVKILEETVRDQRWLYGPRNPGKLPETA
jgi:hypothetical protein